MYVCLCNAVTDKAIRKAVRQHNPHTMKQLRELVPMVPIAESAFVRQDRLWWRKAEPLFLCTKLPN